MKGYILICDEGTELNWFYATIKASHLQPFSKKVFDNKFARFTARRFIVEKITSCDDENKQVQEITCDISLGMLIHRWKVGEIVHYYDKIFKTMEALRQYERHRRNMFAQFDYLAKYKQKIFDGWIYEYDDSGFLTSKHYKKNGKTIRDVLYSRDTDEISKRNYKKNITTITNKHNQLLNTFPFLRSIEDNSMSSPNPSLFITKIIKRRAEFTTLCASYTEKEGRLCFKYRYRYSPNIYKQCHGILFVYGKCVYWFDKLISYNLQTWYQTPWNFIMRTNKKLKCF
jgi:hypothetical protein